MRLIDADKLRNGETLCKVFSNPTDEFYGMLQLIDAQPTATCWEPFLFDKDGTLMNCPEDEQRIFVCDGKQVWCDLFINEGEDGCWLDGASEEIIEGMAWMPMPEPYKGDKYTTADNIRSMTDEQLAEFLKSYPGLNHLSYKEVLNWLKIEGGGGC